MLCNTQGFNAFAKMKMSKSIAHKIFMSLLLQQQFVAAIILGLQSWYPMFRSNHCNSLKSFEDWVPVDDTYGKPSF